MRAITCGKDYPDHRNNLSTWANEHGLLNTGMEMGVAAGGYSRLFLSQWKGLRLFLVDPMVQFPPEVCPDSFDWKTCAENMDSVRDLVRNDPRAVFLRAFSPEIAVLIPDHSLDFIYIDGNHTHLAVAKDVEAWWPKVRPGGMFSGHDWNPDRPDFGIKDVVGQWAKERDLPIGTTPCTSWWIPKP